MANDDFGLADQHVFHEEPDDTLPFGDVQCFGRRDESVREIVSAEKSEVKFIVTDHPVTAYNPACAPGSVFCQYPDDPSIGMKGTQTVFALDADHCLILTNLEYAQDATGVDFIAPHENARFSGHTLARTDTMIRTRFLTPDEVVSINFLLKASPGNISRRTKKRGFFLRLTGSIRGKK